MSAGGTERWLQEMAVELTKRGYPIDFYYCDAAPYAGSDYKHAGTDINRLHYLKTNKVTLYEFKVEKKDISSPTNDWINTNFWDVFDQNRYLFVQSATAGNSEYPFYQINLPIVEFVTLSGNINRDKNVAWTIHLSEWQRRHWLRLGGKYSKSSVIPIPVFPESSRANLRMQLGIGHRQIVFGFHQRDDDHIFSEIPLNAYKEIEDESTHFILLGGSNLYKLQAASLGIKNISFLEHNSSSQIISEFLNTLNVYTHGRSDGETFGSVIAEAMMHGIPVISHKVRVGANAHKDTIGPGGYFAKNYNEYTEFLSRLLSDSNLRKEIGMRGLKFAEANYSLKISADKLAKIYSLIFSGQLPSKRRVKTISGSHSVLYRLQNYAISIILRAKDKLVYQISSWNNTSKS